MFGEGTNRSVEKRTTDIEFDIFHGVSFYDSSLFAWHRIKLLPIRLDKGSGNLDKYMWTH